MAVKIEILTGGQSPTPLTNPKPTEALDVTHCIPTLQPPEQGLGSTHHVTAGAKDKPSLSPLEAFEKVKKIAHRNVYNALEAIEKFNITDPHMRFEIGKIIATKSDFNLDCMGELGITDEGMLFEIAKIRAPLSMTDTLGIIKLGITNQKMIFELAKICALQNKHSYLMSDSIEKFGIKDETLRFEIAKINVREPSHYFYAHLDQYGITDQKMLFEIAKIGAVLNPSVIISEIDKFKITDRNMLFEIAKIVVAYYASSISWDDKFGQVQQLLRTLGIVEMERIVELMTIFISHGSRNAYSIDTVLSLVEVQHWSTLQRAFAFRAFFLASMDDNYFNEFIETDPRFFIVNLQKDISGLFEKINRLPAPVKFESAEEKAKVEKEYSEVFCQLKDLLVRRGASDKALEAIQKGVFNHRHSLHQQRKDLLWLGALAMHYMPDPSLPANTASPFCDAELIPLLVAIGKITDPLLRQDATEALMEITSHPEQIKVLKSLLAGQEERLLIFILLSVFAGVEPKRITTIVEELGNSKYKDAKIMNSIYQMMSALPKSTLSIEKKEELLQWTFNPPVKQAGEARPKYNIRLDEYRKNQRNLLAAVTSLIKFQREYVLEDSKDATNLLNEWQRYMGDLFGIKGDHLSDFYATFGNSKRYPNGLLIYASRLQELPNEMKDPVMPLLGKFAASVLDGSFPKARYDTRDNPHLRTISAHRPDLLKKWQEPLPIKVVLGPNNEQWTIEDSDAWEDLFLFGTETTSCHNIDNAEYCIHLLAPLLDGKIRLMVARDGNGKIAERIVIILPWDPKQKNAAILVERFGTKVGSSDKMIEKELLDSCEQKAKVMDIPLVATSYCHHVPGAKAYPNPLHSLGGPVPLEKVESKFGYTFKKGIYTIDKTHFLWEPSPTDTH